jgi:hypothetical protein
MAIPKNKLAFTSHFRKSVFSGRQQPAKASVLIKIRPGASLPETAIPAITHLMSSAEGLGRIRIGVGHARQF